MSHASVEPGRAVIYTLPARYSDTLRTHEFNAFFRAYRGAAFSVRTLDGWSWASATHRAPQFIATFETREALDAVLNDGSEATLGRLFVDGAVDLHGNIFTLLGVAEYTLRHSDGLSHALVESVRRISSGFAAKLLPGRKVPDRQNWHVAPCPLNLPPSFFQPWLGNFMSHSFASFRMPGDDFDTAQIQSMDRACGWLGLEPGDRLLDLSCGWGSLLLHAGQRYGAEGFGLADNDRQAETASERLAQSGLQRRCRVEHRDMRRQPFPGERFDKAVELGIFQQVSSSDLGRHLRCLKDVMAPGGLLLMHRITRSPEAIPPIASLQPEVLSESLSKELAIAEMSGFELLRAEGLDKEYEETLRIWIERLVAPECAQQTRVYSRAYRVWMLYLMEIATSLHAGDIHVHRVLLRRSAGHSERKRTRMGWQIFGLS